MYNFLFQNIISKIHWNLKTKKPFQNPFWTASTQVYLIATVLWRTDPEDIPCASVFKHTWTHLDFTSTHIPKWFQIISDQISKKARFYNLPADKILKDSLILMNDKFGYHTQPYAWCISATKPTHVIFGMTNFWTLTHLQKTIRCTKLIALHFIFRFKW